MISIEHIKQEDNAAIAELIREVLTEFGANKPGTVFTDPTTDALFELFKTGQSHYFIAKENGIIAGGCGIYPTEGLPEGCVELVKLYVAKSYRGTGLGKQLIERSIAAATSEGYRELYLETLPELHIAVGLYEHLGFEYLDRPYGNSGHFACDLWMRKKLVH
ncbi:MAG: family N-acetyltransferase [Fluviicola sp.]|jgi:putative acetyltransferase|uniref:GNAT family N-acetyltransferase n=1 Tax=Fluviicola sp. TaxID=1917219 RepID=UPI00260D8F70|nr:GNAT family N-acetyltransferase [Fluviicola sp.]MDF3025828.1 family N-acetyltransferase [Fluviicola sp.]